MKHGRPTMLNETPDLSTAEIVDRYYRESYVAVHGSGCMASGNRLLHNSLERGRNGAFFDQTLELGAGNLEHLQHVRHDFADYWATDIRISETASKRAQRATDEGRRVHLMQADAAQLPFEDHSMDRLVAGCLIVHLSDPWAAIQEWRRVCKPSGVIDFMVPCEPGFALRLIRWGLSERKAQKVGVSLEDFRLVNALDHVSSFPRIATLIDQSLRVGERSTVTYFPFRVPSWNLNAFGIVSLSLSQA